MRAFLASLAWLAIVSSASGEEGGSSGKYRFFLDGKAFVPTVFSLNGTPEDLQAGDVIFIDSPSAIGLVIGPPGEYRFRSALAEDGLLYLSFNGGKERIAAARLRWTVKDLERVSLNPLAGMAPDEIRDLSGILLEDWNETIAGLLGKADLAGVCLTVTRWARQGPANALPPLPAGLRYLAINEASTEGIEDFSKLFRHRDLLFFALRQGTAAVFDPTVFQGNKGMRALVISGQRTVNFAPLAVLTSLRMLSLNGCIRLEELSFVRGMKDLRDLRIRQTRVSDLSPLSCLESLQTVDATGYNVATLPDGPLPSLRLLKIRLGLVSEEDVAEFRKTHPDCIVICKREEILKEELRGVTRVRLRSGCVCCPSNGREKSRIEESDPEATASASTTCSRGDCCPRSGNRSSRKRSAVL